MATCLLVPYGALVTLTSITATPIAYGSIVMTQEVRCAFDADTDNYTKVWSGNDQPVKIVYASLNLPFTATGAVTAVWMNTANATYTSPGGGNYNTIALISSTDDVTYSQLDLDLYGDGTDLGSGRIRLGVTSPVDSRSSPCNGQCLLYGTQIIGGRYNQIMLGTEGTHIGANCTIYEFMHGLMFTFPPGKIAEARGWSRSFYGGESTQTEYGNTIWHGRKSPRQRRSIVLSMAGLTETELNLYRYIFKYGRGVFPMLFVEDTGSRETWIKVYFTKFNWHEPDADRYSVDCEFEEC